MFSGQPSPRPPPLSPDQSLCFCSKIYRGSISLQGQLRKYARLCPVAHLHNLTFPLLVLLDYFMQFPALLLSLEHPGPPSTQNFHLYLQSCSLLVYFPSGLQRLSSSQHSSHTTSSGKPSLPSLHTARASLFYAHSM